MSDKLIISGLHLPILARRDNQLHGWGSARTAVIPGHSDGGRTDTVVSRVPRTGDGTDTVVSRVPCAAHHILTYSTWCVHRLVYGRRATCTLFIFIINDHNTSSWPLAC